MSKNKWNKGLKFFKDNYFQSADYNQRAYFIYRNWLLSLALLRFKWINLPDTCDERFLEWILIHEAIATIGKPRFGIFKNNFYSTMVTGNAPINIYDNPTKWTSYGNNGWRFRCSSRNAVLIYDNYLRMPITSVLDYFARNLAQYDRTININLTSQHKPIILACPQTMKNDAIQLYKQFAGGEPAILGYDKLNDLVDDIKVIDLKVDFILKDLQDGKERLWNEIYQFLGIQNLPKKAERMIEDEVNANNDITDLRALDGLECRRSACKKLNDRFGLNIDVVWRKDLKSDNYNTLNSVKDMLEINE